ncbi:MAG TPA: FecR domain-containing protein [Puia sp.]|nr:FecR domain-containing protein [Puia sp.]
MDPINNEEDAGRLMARLIQEKLAGLEPVPEVRQRLETWMDEHPEARDAFTELNDPTRFIEGMQTARDVADKKATVYRRLQSAMHGRRSPVRRRLILASAAVAAVLLFFVGKTVIDRYSHNQQKNPSVAHASLPDIAPGGRHAVLTLEDGQQVRLDSAKDELVAVQGASSIRQSNGILSYRPAPSGSANHAGWNMLSTPPGGDFRVVLADGTKCWLNAGSSIRYPTAFQGPYREVAVSGEVYFEVVHNSSQPFRVDIGDRTLEDIGTSFDINAYSDERAVSITLASGSARLIVPGQRKVILHTGQQARLKSDVINGHAAVTISVSEKADIEEVLAWRDELFIFKGASLPDIMRQVGRWYNVSVAYDGPVPSDKFYAYISRARSVSNLLQILEQTGRVRFRIYKDHIQVSAEPGQTADHH